MSRTVRKQWWPDPKTGVLTLREAPEYRGRSCGCCYKYRKKERRARRRKEKQEYGTI